MYNLVPAESEARKLSPTDPVNVPDQMVNHSHPNPKTSSYHSDNVVKKKNSDPMCDICGTTYKNKNSLGVHKRRYHSKLPLRLFSNRKEKKFSSESENDSADDQSDGSMKHGEGLRDDDMRKRKISSDDDTSFKKRKISEDSDSDDKISKRSKSRQGSRALISHPPRKRSISPDTHRVLKKIKRRHAEDSVKRKIRKNLEKRRRNKRKRLRRKVVTPKYIEPRNTDDEVDNVSDSGSSKNTGDDVEKKKK